MKFNRDHSLPEVGTAGSYTRLKVFIGCLLASLVASGATLGTVYCAGRWRLAVGPEIFFAKGIGLIVCVLGCVLLFCLLKEKKWYVKFVGFCFSIGLLLASFSWVSNSMVELYVAGFKQAVFSAASAEQWGSTAMIVKKNSMDSSKDQRWMGNLLPDFIWKVYPGITVATGAPDWSAPTNDMHIWISWRGWSFDRAIVIGPVKSYTPDFRKILYRKNYSNNISFMLLGGSD